MSIDQGSSSDKWRWKQVLDMGTDFGCGAAPVTWSVSYWRRVWMNWLGQGTVLICSGRVQAPTGTVVACPPLCSSVSAFPGSNFLVWGLFA